MKIPSMWNCLRNILICLTKISILQVKFGTDTHNQNLQRVWRPSLYYPGEGENTEQEASPPSVPTFVIAIIAEEQIA